MKNGNGSRAANGKAGAGSVMHYRAVREDGSIVQGEVNAGGRQEAVRQIERDGLRVIEVAAPSVSKKPVFVSWRRALDGRGVSSRAVEEFTRQLSNLLGAGVSLSRSLRILCREASSPAAGNCWKAIHDAVVDGMPLAGAMAQHPRVFPSVHVAMVQAGETGGFLAAVLGQIADFQSRSKEMRSKVLSALIYPAVLLTLAILVIVFLLIFFIPRFKAVFTGFGAELPLITRAIVACSEGLSRYGLVSLIIVVVLLGWAHHWLQTPEGRRIWQGFTLRLPIIGPLKARYAMTRFCRMLGTLLAAGVPLIAALRVACESLGSQTLVDALAVSIDQVKQGSSLAASLRDCRVLFPGPVLEMIGVAEETGRLDKELLRIAAVAEADVDRWLRTAIALVEPLMLFLMASFIGTIFVGMVIPIFALQDYIR